MKRIFIDLKMMHCLLLSAMALALLSGAGRVQAHSFDIGFIAPFSGPDSRQGREALDGFLLATRERDGHALEESDGHLGGLDSYVIKIDSNSEPDAVRKQLNELINRQEIVFLTGVAVPAMLITAVNTSGESQGIFVDPVSTAVYRSAIGRPESLRTPANVPFVAAFRDAYGYEPSDRAMAGYIAARIIDATVSAVEGRLSLRVEVQRALGRAYENLP